MKYKKFLKLNLEEQILFSKIFVYIRYSRWFFLNFALGSKVVITNERLLINLAPAILIIPFYSSFYFEKSDTVQKNILKISYTRYTAKIFTGTGDIIKIWGSAQKIREFKQAVGVYRY